MHTCDDMASFEVALQQIITEYDRNLCLKVRQLEIFDHLWKRGRDITVSLPTGYGKSLVFHLCVKLLCAKQLGQPGTTITIVISPLNIIQKDQLTKLRRHNISACRLEVCGRATSNVFLEEEEKVRH